MVTTAKTIRLAIAILASAALAQGCTNSSSTSALSASGPETEISALPGAKDGNLEVVANLPPPPQTNEGRDDLVAENDLLEIDVFQVDELDRTVRVDSKGRISLALIGTVDAKGKTIPQLESDIEARYRTNYLQNPEVSVFMKESAGQRVTVDGAVMKPGIYPVASTSTLLQLVALAGGLQEIADETKLYVFRDHSGRKLVANYSVKEVREGKKADPRVFGGDVIVVFQSGAKVAAKNLREALGIASGAARLAVPF